tara:strand:- start:885 stop:1340 length:456 start_codon:yes stop_codon:yes gene_type:complete
MELKIANTEKTVAEGMEEIKNFLMDPSTEGADLPIRHSFAPGIYAREMSIPEGTLLIGKIHKHRHHNFLMQGSIIVLTEDEGVKLLQAPLMIVSEPGTQRVGYAVTDTIWTTVHENKDNTEDLGIIEKRTVTDNKQKYIEYKNKLIKNITI